jgi:hypothetical protein
MKVSEKGGVSIYGLGCFPVTLYNEQWIRLLDMADDIRSFIAEKVKTESERISSILSPPLRREIVGGANV